MLRGASDPRAFIRKPQIFNKAICKTDNNAWSFSDILIKDAIPKQSLFVSKYYFDAVDFSERQPCIEVTEVSLTLTVITILQSVMSRSPSIHEESPEFSTAISKTDNNAWNFDGARVYRRSHATNLAAIARISLTLCPLYGNYFSNGIHHVQHDIGKVKIQQDESKNFVKFKSCTS